MPGIEAVELNVSDDIKFEELPSGGGGGGGNYSFGTGAELLMNTAKMGKDKESGKSSGDDVSDIDLSDLKEMADELDDDAPSKKRPSLLFGSNEPESITLKLDDHEEFGDNHNNGNNIKLVEEETNANTWDGFKKMSSVPVLEEDAMPKTRKEDILREKFIYLRKLEELETKKNVRLTKQYTMESSLDEMKGEYEMIIAEREKANSVKFQGSMLKMAIMGIEMLNNKLDPFDIKLDGWHEQVEENITDYDDIFAELHEKYHSKAKMAPELKLLFQLAGSAVMIHMTNKMADSMLPSMDSYMKQHPEVMKQFSQAAVSSVSDSSPGFAGFMNSVLGGGNQSAPPPTMMGPPPPAIQTKASHPGRAGGITERGNSAPNRPDLTFAASKQETNNSTEKSTRSEMKGPSDISSILDGLKTKKVNITSGNIKREEGSTISASDLNELTSERVPKSRRKRSEKNTVSLDI